MSPLPPVTVDTPWWTVDNPFVTADGTLVVPPRDNLLPSGATPLERALADTDGRLDDIDTDLVRRVKVAAEAPAAYLPYLAWERSVDVWDPAWPEAIARAVIDAAPAVHRYKGTRFAVTTALAALGIDATITEWWQDSPRSAPYTFRVTAYARARLYDGPVLDARLIRVVFVAIMRTKPLSRAFDFKLGAAFPRRLGVAGVARAVVRPRVALHPRLAARGASRLGLVGALVGRTRVRAACILRTA